MTSQFLLFRDRRFWPFFIVQAGGAFNDNLMKTAVVVLIAYGLWDVGGANPAAIVSLAAALFILPFILFCPLAGEMSDKFSKNAMIRAVKSAEILIVLSAIPVLYLQSLPLALCVVMALGTHSAFFSPAKFAILPQHLLESELIAANGLVSTGTYLAILAGTILGALLAPMTGGIAVISVLLLIVAGAGLAASFLIPAAPAPQPDLRLNLNPLRTIAGTLRCAFTQKPGVLQGIAGVSWFYFVASAFHSQFPNFTKQALGVDTAVLTIFMVIFSFGIGLGGMVNNKILKGRIDTKFVPWAMVGIALFTADLCWVSWHFPKAPDGSLMSLSVFVSDIGGVRILFDLFALSFCGGVYVIPLRALVQSRARGEEKARVMAAGSMGDSIMILLSSVLAIVFLSLGFGITELFFTIGLACALAALYFFRKRSL